MLTVRSAAVDDFHRWLTDNLATIVARGIADLERLDGLKGLLQRLGYDTSDVTLAIFSLNGFHRDLERAAARRADVELVSLERIYGVELSGGRCAPSAVRPMAPA